MTTQRRRSPVWSTKTGLVRGWPGRARGWGSVVCR
jgi:hypothetical protein